MAQLKAKLIAKYGEQSVSRAPLLLLRLEPFDSDASLGFPKPRYPKRGHWPAG